MSLAKPFFPVQLYAHSPGCQQFGVKKKASKCIAESVHQFFNQDDVLCQTPGKKECKTLKDVRKQKQYLTHSLHFLHQKYCQENNFVISYTSFCQLRPFWVVPENIDQRDTSLCITHENIKILHKQLRKSAIKILILQL